jgi:hypothetical protein
VSKTTLVRTVATFGLLTAGYLGYDRGFALLAARISRAPTVAAEPRKGRDTKESRTSREATELAIRGFGEGHWSTDPELTLRLYNPERGYWMYAGAQERSKDGKRWTFTPFAVVSMSRDRKSVKTMVGKQAVLDFDQPTGLTKPGAKSGHVVRARIIGEVVIRDDKGTPARKADDLIIGPLSYLEYVEDPGREKLGPIPQARVVVAEGEAPGPRIRSESHVLIRDNDLTMTGDGLRIDLIPTAPSTPGGSTGFNGARTAWLLTNVRVHIDDVGRSGILPGGAPEPKEPPKAPGPDTKDGKPAPKKTPTPLDLRSDGPMRVDLAKPNPPIKWGPPAPPGPVKVFFTKNVEVTRGATEPGQLPAQLDSDNLALVLVQGDQPPPPAGSPKPDAADATDPGPMQGLTLRRARADGHAVWLQSPSDGTRVRCHELIHEKFGPGKPEVTRLLADSGKQLWIEKIDRATQGKDKGKVTAVSVIETRSATITQSPGDDAGSTIVADGPGTLETRPERDRPIERTASWDDRLIVLPEGQGEQTRQVILLTGTPTIRVVDEFDLAANRSIKIWLRPNPKDKAKEKADPARAIGSASPGGDASKIESLEALGSVHLVATGKPAAGANPDDTPLPKRTMDARDLLVVHFDAPPPPKPAPKPATADAKVEDPAPTVAAAGPAPKPAEAEEPKEPEPDMDVRADKVWAWITPGGEPGKRGDLREAQLVGEVELHQGPTAGKARGTDLVADQARVLNDGPGKARLLAKGTPSRPAEAATDEFRIQGPFLGLEQAADYAWVMGRGRLIQHAATPRPDGDGDDADKDEPPADDGAPRAKGPVVVTWNVADDELGMEFFGRGEAYHKRLAGPATPPSVAEARFRGDVEANVDDSRMFCDEMLAVMDKGVSFIKPRKDPRAKKPAEPEPRPQLAGVRCEGDVDIFSRKTEPDTGNLVELQRVSGEIVTFDRKSGKFQVLTPGIVRLYSLPDADDPAKPGAGRTEPPRSTVARTSARPSGDPKDNEKGTPKTKADGLVLTRIQFRGHMEGKFTETAKGKAPGPRRAWFYRAVEVIRGKVASEDDDLRIPGDDASLFRRHPDVVILRSDVLEVENQPPPPLRLKKGQKPPADRPKARNYMVAQSRATARTRDTAIQGDEIKYNSESETFFVYGAAGRGVTIVRQERAGQPPSVTQGRAAKFNRLTGSSELIHPETIQFVDANTGVRPGVAGTADPFPKKERPKRKEATLPGRSNRERRNFSGGQ